MRARLILLSMFLWCASGLTPAFGISGGNVFPDPWFGNLGSTAYMNPVRSDYVNRVAIQADGKIVIGGYAELESPFNQYFKMARYMEDGSTLDTTFNGGVVTGFELSYRSQIQDIAILNSGKILAAGVNFPVPADANFAMAQYNSDGTLDPAFGTGGQMELNIGANPTVDGIRSIAIQNDGKILAAGYAQLSGGNYDFAIARFLPDGTIDPTFSGNGRLFVDFGSNDTATQIVIDAAASKILVAGSAEVGAVAEIGLVRLNMNGTLDASFGSGGKALVALGSNSTTPDRLRLEIGGKLLIGGVLIDLVNPPGSFLARITTTGALDTSFASGGWSSITAAPFGDFDIRADGEIIETAFFYGNEILLAGYLPDGTLDTSFGNGGYVEYVGQYSMIPFSLAIDPKGRMVVGGGLYNSDNTHLNFLVARFSECFFCDDFQDHVLDSNWTYDGDPWIENSLLVSPAFQSKSKAFATPAFAGCDNCSVGTTVNVDPASSQVDLFAWYLDKKNCVEVLIKKNSKWVLKLKSNGSSSKAKSTITTPATSYNIAVTYDGSQYALKVDGEIVAVLPAVQAPVGTVGFQVKKGQASWEDIRVVPN